MLNPGEFIALILFMFGGMLLIIASIAKLTIPERIGIELQMWGPNYPWYILIAVNSLIWIGLGLTILGASDIVNLIMVRSGWTISLMGMLGSIFTIMGIESQSFKNPN